QPRPPPCSPARPPTALDIASGSGTAIDSESDVATIESLVRERSRRPPGEVVTDTVSSHTPPSPEDVVTGRGLCRGLRRPPHHSSGIHHRFQSLSRPPPPLRLSSSCALSTCAAGGGSWWNIYRWWWRRNRRRSTRSASGHIVSTDTHACIVE